MKATFAKHEDGMAWIPGARIFTGASIPGQKRPCAVRAGHSGKEPVQLESSLRIGGEGAMRLEGKPYGLTKGERRFGIAAGIAMFALAVLAAL